jgi:hypothetical protein
LILELYGIGQAVRHGRFSSQTIWKLSGFRGLWLVPIGGWGCLVEKSNTREIFDFPLGYENRHRKYVETEAQSELSPWILNISHSRDPSIHPFNLPSPYPAALKHTCSHCGLFFSTSHVMDERNGIIAHP